MRNALPDASTDKPVRIGCDNQGALKLINTGAFKDKAEHIDVKYHHVHDEQIHEGVDFRHVGATANTADLLKKPFSRQRYAELTKMTGLCELANGDYGV